MADIKKVTTRHRAIMQDLCSGMKPCEISAKHDITENRLSVLKSSPLFKAELQEMQDDFLATAKARAAGLLGKALDVVEDSLYSEDEKIKLSAAKDVQNRTGLVHEPKIEAGSMAVRIVINE